MTFGIFERQHFLQSQGSQHSVLETSMQSKRPKLGLAMKPPSSWVMTTTPLGKIATSTWVKLRDEASSSQYNEIKKLCCDDRDAWFECLWIVLQPLPLPSTEHYVRRSARKVGCKRKVEPPTGPLK